MLTFNRCTVGTICISFHSHKSRAGKGMARIIKFVLQAKKLRPREVSDLSKVAQLTFWMEETGVLFKGNESWGARYPWLGCAEWAAWRRGRGEGGWAGPRCSERLASFSTSFKWFHLTGNWELFIITMCIVWIKINTKVVLESGIFALYT